MDLTALLSDFIDELLGLHSAYAITDIEALDSTADAAAFMRLRVRVCDALLAEGWSPTPEAASALDRDRATLRQADNGHDVAVMPSSDEERAALRARARRVRDDARRTSDHVADQRRAREDSRDEVEQMRQALASRAVIEQAKGIAMERYGLRADVAWAWLVRTSQNRNIKLRAIAEELVESVAPATATAESGPKAPTAQSNGRAAKDSESAAMSTPSA